MYLPRELRGLAIGIARVEGGDRRIVPGGDGALEDLGERAGQAAFIRQVAASLDLLNRTN